MPPRRWPSCWSAPVCTRRRPPVWRSRPIWRREASRPRVVAFLYVMLLLGMVASALVLRLAAGQFSQIRLIQVIQGAALVTMVLNLIALWKQEARRALAHARRTWSAPPFRNAWRAFRDGGRSSRVLVAVGLGTAGFSMQDILLEPYGGEILKLSVGATTTLTALLAAGTLAALTLAARG